MVSVSRRVFTSSVDLLFVWASEAVIFIMAIILQTPRSTDCFCDRNVVLWFCADIILTSCRL